MSKPKEFWIDEQTICWEPDEWKKVLVAEDPTPETTGNAVHVIEYSAYESVQKKLKIAIEALKTIKRGLGPRDEDPYKHPEECLESIQNVADEALEEIEEIKS